MGNEPDEPPTMAREGVLAARDIDVRSLPREDGGNRERKPPTSIRLPLAEPKRLRSAPHRQPLASMFDRRYATWTSSCSRRLPISDASSLSSIRTALSSKSAA